MQIVWAMFLNLMRDYDALTMSEEEAFEKFQDVLLVALPTVQLKGMLEDVEVVEQEFSRELSPTEGLILGYATVVAWLAPYLYSSELLSAQMTSTDFNQFSGNMRLQTYIKLNNEAEYRLNQAILDYDTRNEYKSIREEVKKYVK